MKRRQREAVVAAMDQRLAAHGSWCGETHLQKAVYFLQVLLGVPTEFGFILYKYGPFSRELRAELASMRADGFLELVPQPQPYGPTLQVTPIAEQQLIARWPKTLGRHSHALDFAAERLSGLGVSDLERMATALWVRRETPDARVEDQAARLNEIKPHVSPGEAMQELRKIQSMEREAARR
jgi:uncharacterized protein YwgA